MHSVFSVMNHCNMILVAKLYSEPFKYHVGMMTIKKRNIEPTDITSFSLYAFFTQKRT